MTNQIVIDASNTILGRIASNAAKQALLGKSVIIVNCNDAIVSGSKANIIAEYEDIRKKGGASLKGPFFPKQPDRIVKRTIRGMLSYKHGRGEAAFARIRCYNTVPKEHEAAKKTSFASVKNTKTIKLADLSSYI